MTMSSMKAAGKSDKPAASSSRSIIFWKKGEAFLRPNGIRLNCHCRCQPHHQKAVFPLSDSLMIACMKLDLRSSFVKYLACEFNIVSSSNSGSAPLSCCWDCDDRVKSHDLFSCPQHLVWQQNRARGLQTNGFRFSNKSQQPGAHDTSLPESVFPVIPTQVCVWIGSV